MLIQYVCLAAAWILFCLFHSLLADDRVELALRARLGPLAPWYRLLYNLFAVITLAPALFMEKIWRGPLIDLGSGDIIRQAVFYGSAAIFVWVLAHYNGTNISGLSPSAGPSALAKNEIMRSDGPLRHVRHPLYSLGIILLWSRPLADTVLITNAILCVYIFIGAWLEEQKLIAQFGQEYVAYKREVPAFLPFRLFR